MNCFISDCFEGFDDNINFSNEETESIIKILFENIKNGDVIFKKYCEETTEEDKTKSLLLFQSAAFLLEKFVINNFTGPVQDICEVCLEFGLEKTIIEEADEIAFKSLSIDSENIRTAVKFPSFMHIAKQIIIDHYFFDDRDAILLVVYNTWMFLHESKFSSVKPKMIECINSCLESMKDEKNCKSNKYMIKNLFTMCCSSLHLHEFELCEEILMKLEGLLNFSYSLTGCMGLKMKYQQKPLAQLVLKIEAMNKSVDNSVNSNYIENVEIEDDSPLLPYTVFVNKESVNDCDLTLEQQLLLLYTCRLMQKTLPKDEILIEQIKPFIEILNRNSKSWIISYESLIWRSVYDFDSIKRMERGLKQFEMISESFRKKEPNGKYRSKGWIYSGICTMWQAEEMYAETLKKLGCHKSALDVYLRLNSMDKIIECYIYLGRSQLAQELLEKQIKLHGDDPLLYCLLGDVTKDIEYYKKAWEISGHRSARSQKMLGLHYFKKDLNKCAEYLNNSLRINGFQESLWFTLGCVQMRLDQYSEAVSSFLQCTRLEPDNYECWSNLAAIHMKRKRLDLAHRIMKEAIKYNFSNFKIWENYLFICMDIARFQEAIYACRRLVELNSSIGEGIFAELFYALKENSNSLKYGYKPETFHNDMLTLLDFYCNSAKPTWRVWKIYAMLYENQTEEKSLMKESELLIKSIRNLVFYDTAWETDETISKQVLMLSKDIIKCTDKILIHISNETTKNQLLNDFKLIFSNVLSKCYSIIDESSNISTKNYYTDFVEELKLCIGNFSS